MPDYFQVLLAVIVLLASVAVYLVVMFVPFLWLWDEAEILSYRHPLLALLVRIVAGVWLLLVFTTVVWGVMWLDTVY